MRSGLGYNNYKIDKLQEMHVRNEFRVNGYYTYFMIKDEKWGEDLVLNEFFSSNFERGFFIPAICLNFQFETSNIFSKFGISIPNQIDFLMRQKDFQEMKTKIQGQMATGIDAPSFPEEGDLIFLPLQNKALRHKKITELSNSELAPLIKGANNGATFLFEITNIDDKQFIFNGMSYYVKITCKVYDKKITDNFSGDLDIINDKIDNAPEPSPITNPTSNTDASKYYGNSVKEEMASSDMLKFD